jgi:protein-histidine N-methyltransferase
LALLHWALDSTIGGDNSSVSIVLADYNPTVLQLVTLPNIILSWALYHRPALPLLDEAFSSEGELELSKELLEAFEESLASRSISLHFFSGAWSAEFVDLLNSEGVWTTQPGSKNNTLLLGAETIYSPFALDAFTQTMFCFLEKERSRGAQAQALVGAKKLYFGVGGSLDDFVIKARERGANVEQLREETEGVRRGVVRCTLP